MNEAEPEYKRLTSEAIGLVDKRPARDVKDAEAMVDALIAEAAAKMKRLPPKAKLKPVKPADPVASRKRRDKNKSRRKARQAQAGVKRHGRKRGH